VNATNRSGVSVMGVCKKYSLISTANCSEAPKKRSAAPGSMGKVAFDSMTDDTVSSHV
jgi:hypothetical protein